MRAVDDEHRRMNLLHSRRVLEDVEPVRRLHFVDDAEPALHGTVQYQPADARPRGQVYRRHTADGLAVADDLVVRDAAVVREVVVRGLDIRVEVGLARHAGALPVPAVLVGEDVDLQPSAHVPQMVEHDPDVRAVTVAEEKRPGGVRAPEVEAEDDVSATRPHTDGVDGDALRGEIGQRREPIVSLDQKDLLLFRHMVAWRSWWEECHLIHHSPNETGNQRQAADAANETVAAG
mmetsp:Transcript_71987/g.188664  ORF Transcript_71987/g.188664 Transcript_71987/m.188664 type:complete len:234 (+) Transcript_71987:412-1113(+)